MVSTELWPLAKVGGLADMVSSLARTLRDLGQDVRCALPSYSGVRDRLPPTSREIRSTDVRLQTRSGRTLARIDRFGSDDLPAPVLLVSHPLFERHGIYDDPVTRVGYPDNGLRWAVFGRALHAVLGKDGWMPQIVHAHDHQSALLPALLRWSPGRASADRGPRPASVFTIHNLGYQGIEKPCWVVDAGLPPSLHYPAGPLEFHGKVNLMKMGIEAADRLTTVSPRYAEEIRTSNEFGAGLEGVLEANASKLTGILNGIDTRVWDPAIDPHLPFRYTRNSIANKARNRAALRQELGLAEPSLPEPLIGMVSRLATQKGFDLLLPVLDEILGDGIQIAILGSGEERFERALAEIAARHPGSMALRTGHEEGLAHRIEGGADMFLMPSRYEPCGLNQMYSLRYGTVPLVRAVGGLSDTVVDLDEAPDRANGFVFRAYEPAEVLKTVRRAARAFKDRRCWRDLVLRGMDADFSWESSARRYLEVYERALEDRK